MENKKQNLLIGLMILVIAVLFYQNFKMKRSFEEITMKSQLYQDNLEQQISNVDYQIHQINHTVLEQNNNIRAHHFHNGTIDTTKNQIQTTLEIELKESNAIDSLLIYSKAFTDDKDVSELETKEYVGNLIEGQASIIYACEMTLSYQYNYSFTIYSIDTEGNKKLLNTEDIDYYLKDQFNHRVNLNSAGTATDRERIEYDFSLENNTFDQEEFKIKKVEVEIYYQDTLVLTKDMTQFNIVNQEELDRKRIQIAAGEIDMSESLPQSEYGSFVTDQKGIERGDFVLKFRHDDAGINVNNNNFPEYVFKVIVTLADGEIFKFNNTK